jgi:predicted DNA-binding ribbon-helix-helix protein
MIVQIKKRIFTMIEKKTVRNKSIATRFTEEQSIKLKALAEKKGVSIANLMGQLTEIGYKEVTKNKTF